MADVGCCLCSVRNNVFGVQKVESLEWLDEIVSTCSHKQHLHRITI